METQLKDLEKQLPKNLASMLKDLRKGIRDLEKQIDKARKDREVRWDKLEKQLRKDTQKVLKRFGLGPAKKKSARKKSKKSKR
jgi:septal ring factor EnvC (AmiA/AmiB activator)